MTVTIEEMLAELKRELALRKNVYPKFVGTGRFTQEDADRHMARLQAVFDLVNDLASNSKEDIVESDDQKRTGRPKKPDEQVRKHTAGVRLRDDLYTALKESAKQHNRTISAEIEHRLSESLSGEEHVL